MMDIQRVNTVLAKAIMGLQEAEMFPMAFQVVLDGTPDVPPWDLVAEAYGASWAWTQKPQKYPGMMGKRYRAALKRGYVDLGLVDPKVAKSYRLGPKNLPGDLMDVMKNGVAFIRDPEGVMRIFGLVGGSRLGEKLKQELAWVYQDEAGLADERGDFEMQQALMRGMKLADSAKVSISPVKGKTGPGWKVVMKPSPEAIEKSLGL
jgi:hypothetical protein